MSLTKTSKFLSLILRHKPEIVGLKLDKNGWANVAELLEKMPTDFAMLEKIVAEDEKQRYSFNADKTLIRANQGHSIPVDVELEEVEPPQFLYHGTGEKFFDAILSRGLIRKSRLYVHLSSDVSVAEKVGRRHGKPIIFLIESKRMFYDGYKFFRSVNGVWLTEKVPRQYLKIISDKGGNTIDKTFSN